MRSAANYRSRIFHRHRFDFRIKLIVNRDGRAEVVHGRTRDLSFGGIGVVLTRQLEYGTLGILVIKFPKVGVEVQLPTVVTHGKGFHCGLQFHKLSGEQKLLIQKICKALPA